jgi:hypothetical protein
MNRRPFRRFVRWFAGLMAIYLVLAAGFSTAVDPWRVNRAPWSINSLDDAREISDDIRLGKAGLANLGNWQAVILGSSRMEITFDSTHRAFAGQRAVNLAMAASTLYETIAVGNYALVHNPQIETIILGIDAGDLHNDLDSRIYTNFYDSPFAGNHDRIEHVISWLIGERAFADSIATLQRHFRHKSPKRDAHGRLLQPNQPANLRQYVEFNYSRGFETPLDPWSTNTRNLCQAKADLLAGFLGRVRRSGIELHIVSPPQHALKLVHPTLNTPATICWEQDLLVLAEICKMANEIPSKAPPIRLWNFFTFNDFNTTPMPTPGAPSQRMPGWYDLGHTVKQSGDIMLDAMFAGRPSVPAPANPMFPDLLTTDWVSYKARWIEAHEKYCTTHPDDVAWWRGLAASSLTKEKAPPHAADTE